MKANILVTCSNNGEMWTRLKSRIAGCTPDGRVEECRTLEDMGCRLRRPRQDLQVAVVLAADHGELERVVGFRDLLGDLPLILILPDREPETVALGHMMYPRLLSYADGDLNDVGETLGKMLKAYRRASG
ncbi:MAG: hypothetical protein ACLFOY_02130 [Desulfatibacillaceae bacterium]